MRKLTFFVSIILLAFFVSTSQTFAATQRFSDVPTKHANFKEIEYVAKKHIMSGRAMGAVGNNIFYSPTEFDPSGHMERRLAAYYIINSLGASFEPYENPNYKDITETSLLYKHIAIATQKGLFKSSTNFNPDRELTRAEAAYMITKAFNLKGTSKHTFSDVSNSNFYYEAIQALVANNITVNSAKFNPNANITRAQFATFLARAMEPSYRPKASASNTNTSTAIKYKDGLVPKTLKSKYTFRERYENENHLHVFNKVANKSANTSSRKITMSGWNKVTKSTSSIVYYEDAKRFKVTIKMPYASGLVDVNYPIKSGNSYTKYEKDAVNGGQIKHVFKVNSTTATKTVEGKKYTNVTVIEDNAYFEGSSYPMISTYYFVKNVGIIAFNSDLGNFTLINK